jgi:hypothetical protein
VRRLQVVVVDHSPAPSGLGGKAGGHIARVRNNLGIHRSDGNSRLGRSAEA